MSLESCPSVFISVLFTILLQLGGKNPGVVFADADLEQCIPVVVKSCFANQGEVCLCSERLYVQQEIYETFVQKFVAATRYACLYSVW